MCHSDMLYMSLSDRNVAVYFSMVESAQKAALATMHATARRAMVATIAR
jgi:hypothetical protein